MWRSTVSAITTLAVLIPALVAARSITTDYSVLLMLIFAPVFFLLASVIHELGHAFAAWLIDWDVHVIDVARVSYLPARRSFGRVPIGSARRLVGYVFATPSRLEDWSSRWRLLFISGGILANLCTAALCQVAALYFAAASPVAAALCIGLGLTSLVVAVVTLIPVYRDTGSRSDGAQLFDVLRGRELSIHRRIAARVSGLTIDRVPAKDWPSALIAAIEAAIDYPQRFAILTSHYLSVGATAEALAALRQIQSPGEVDIYRSIHAFLVALVERDTVAARALLAEPVPHDFGYWRALAVILALEERHAEARAAVVEARKAGLAELGAAGDDDDATLFAAIEDGRELPTHFGGSAP